MSDDEKSHLLYPAVLVSLCPLSNSLPLSQGKSTCISVSHIPLGLLVYSPKKIFLAFFLSLYIFFFFSLFCLFGFDIGCGGKISPLAYFIDQTSPNEQQSKWSLKGYKSTLLFSLSMFFFSVQTSEQIDELSHSKRS